MHSLSSHYAQTSDALPLRPHLLENDTGVKLWSSLAEICEMIEVPVVDQEDMRFQHLKFKPGQRVFIPAQPFDCLYIVYSGFLKSTIVDELGNEQVLAFPMKGDILGVDGIDSGTYQTEVISQSVSELIVLPFKALMMIGQAKPQFELEMLAAMGRELTRQQGLLFALRGLSAEARVARFLHALSERFAALGYSSTEFNLRMTRQEIGNYLGIALETVSRVLAALQDEGHISVSLKAIKIHNPEALQSMRRIPPRRRVLGLQ